MYISIPRENKLFRGKVLDFDKRILKFLRRPTSLGGISESKNRLSEVHVPYYSGRNLFLVLKKHIFSTLSIFFLIAPSKFEKLRFHFLLTLFFSIRFFLILAITKPIFFC